jgi:hypothetical protein
MSADQRQPSLHIGFHALLGAIWPLVPARTALAAALEDPGAAADEADRAIDLVRAKQIWSWGGPACLIVARARPDRAAALTAELAAGIAGRSAPAALTSLRTLAER